MSDWKRSSFCANSGCLEVDLHSGEFFVYVRDAAGHEIHATHGEWLAFVAGVQNNEFNLPEEL